MKELDLTGSPGAGVDGAEFSMEVVGGRTLRVARWSWNKLGGHSPLLFFNGIGINIEAIAPMANALTERPFLTFDMPGVGGSPDPLVPYTICSMSVVARDLLDRFGIDRADVMGMSWGGGVAQQFALQHPSRVRRLVLAATGAGMVMIPGDPTAISPLLDPRNLADPAFTRRYFANAVEAMAGGGGEHTARITPPGWLGYTYQLLAMAGWTSAPALPFLTASTLIMMGDEDQTVPLANGHMLNTLIPGSRMEVFKGGGHLFLLTHRVQALRALRRFLDAPDAMRKKAA